MGRLAWVAAPVVAQPISLPDPPQTDNQAVNDWMQKVKEAVEQASQPSVEVQNFLDDLIQAIKDMDRDAINSLSSITETAGATYTANEQTMLANLKTAVNGLLTNL